MAVSIKWCVRLNRRVNINRVQVRRVGLNVQTNEILTHLLSSGYLFPGCWMLMVVMSILNGLMSCR